MQQETKTIVPSLSLFMAGGNTDAEKEWFQLGYNSAMKDKDLVDWPVVTAFIEQGEAACNADKAISFLEWAQKEGYFNTGILENGTHYWAKEGSTMANTSADLWRMFDNLVLPQKHTK